jgi:Cu(I)/Ag(I) efflux system membrane fusion protein
LAVPIALAGGFVLGHLRGRETTPESKAILYYVDPMHPAYRSDKPGIAPDCGMKLVPVYAKEAGLGLVSPSPSGVRIDQATQSLYGIRLAKVEMSSGKGLLGAFGRVVPDQTRVYHVNLGTPGLVKETHGDAVGSRVAKDQSLAVIYSSEILYAAAGYLSGKDRVPAGAMTDIAPSAQKSSSIASRTDYLRYLGMSDSQIQEMNRTHKVPEEINVLSPVDGFILSRNISPGLRFEKNTEFYTIADLSHIWIEAEVFGKDAQAFRPGTIARITMPDSGESFRARVGDALPEVDPATRTLKLRLEAENPGFRLRPDMFVNVELPVAHSSGLTVPADALLDSGSSKRIFVETAAGYFEPREVETGWRSGDRVEIVHGLREGETVVSGGTFLIDSESRLRLASNAGAASADLSSISRAGERARLAP